MRRSLEWIVIGIIVWFTVLIYVFHNQVPIESSNIDRRDLDKAISAINQLQNQNQQLLELNSQFSKISFKNGSNDLSTADAASIQKLQTRLRACRASKEINVGVISKEQEVLIKRTHNNLVEIGYNVERELELLKKHPDDLSAKIDGLLVRFATQQQAALIDSEDLSSLNDEWRRKEAQELKEMIQSRIHFLQNPANCKTARQLQCELNLPCGFGCQIHHVAYCFMVAYGTKRTLIIDSQNWRYNPEGWDGVFKPVSETCVTPASSFVTWSGEEETKDTQAVIIHMANGLMKPPPYLPLGIPDDIADRLLRLHGNPSVWWVGQFTHYLMRPQSWLQNDLDAVVKASGFELPVVGVHVRRTDKVGTEAAFHSIDEYMKHVISWYDKLDLRLSKTKGGKKAIRRVYLASDDSSVLPEARKQYPDYVFYGDTKIANSAGLGSRYNKNSLRGVLIDIFMLSKCSYLSCTFSSQICRVAYELMQSLHPDASSYFHSLDDIYFFGGQTEHEQIALYPHKGGDGVIDMHVGDLIHIAGNHWDGYSKAYSNRQTGKTGLYPSYKVEEVFRRVKYPTYSEMNKKMNSSQ